MNAVLTYNFLDSCKVRLNWSQASSNNGRIEGYKVLYYPDGSPNSREYYGQLITNNYATVNLSAMTDYKFEIVS